LRAQRLCFFQQGNGASAHHLPVYVRLGAEVKEHFDKKILKSH
jgi:hypothetical protein